VDEKRIWKKLRSELGLDGERLQGFSEFADMYFRDYVLVHNRSHDTKLSRIRIFKRFFSNTPAESFSTQLVDRFINTRKKAGVSNSTINHELAVLSHMFQWAQQGGYLSENPISGVKKLKVVEWVGERPDEATIDAIFSSFPVQVLPIFTFMRETGCRRGEAISLTWMQVDYARATVNFKQTKNGRSRQVPLTNAALAALSAMPKYGATVFYHPATIKPFSEKSLRRPWIKARNKANSALRIHDLRHAYAIKLAESGCPMHFISEVLGHGNTEFTRKTYARYSPESASSAVLKILEGGKKCAVMG
jgi:integrase